MRSYERKQKWLDKGKQEAIKEILDYVLNFNLDYQEACEWANKEIAVTEKIQQKLKANKDGAVQLELQF